MRPLESFLQEADSIACHVSRVIVDALKDTSEARAKTIRQGRHAVGSVALDMRPINGV